MNKAVIITLLIIILFFNCEKNKVTKNSQNNREIEITEFEESSGIDFNRMQKKVEEAKNLNIDVFFAIAVLHKKYILDLEDIASKMSEDDQHKFYEEKKNEFFNSIKFSEDEYNTFMQKNPEKLIEYQNEHIEIRDYLTTIN